MANDSDNGEHPYVSQQGVYVPSVAFRERFDVSQLGVGAAVAPVDTPQVAAANGNSVVDRAVERTATGTSQEVTLNGSSWNDDSQETVALELFPESQGTTTTTVDNAREEQDDAAKNKPRNKRYSFRLKRLIAHPHTSVAEFQHFFGGYYRHHDRKDRTVSYRKEWENVPHPLVASISSWR
jgi:hypothetical protein